MNHEDHCICPHCFETQILEEAIDSQGTDDKPQTGSLSMCVVCGNLSIYDENMQLRLLNAAEEAEIAADEGLQQHLAMMRSIVTINKAAFDSSKGKK
ncbi:hypothetical protein [Acinetobacter sp.]|uniref:hypothetical protein n=1 Tax=Acinetobacter sp. TaxID=472 RepID=UPI00388CF2BF